MSSTNAQTPVRTTIILTGPNDWDKWLEVVKTKAEAGKVREYVDPSKAEGQLEVLSRPLITIRPKGPTPNGFFGY